MRYALVNADGLVVNVIVWDGETEWQPPEEITVVKVPDGQPCGPRWTFDGTDWVAPPPVEDEEFSEPET